MPLLNPPIKQDTSTAPPPLSLTWTQGLCYLLEPTFALQIPSPVALLLNCPANTATDGSTPAGMPSTAQSCSWYQGSIWKDSRVSTLTQQRGSNLQWMGHVISPEHPNRGFSTGIMQESVTKVMRHDMDTSSLKTGHAHPVSSESTKTTPLIHCGPPQASRTVGRTSEVISPMNHRTATSYTTVTWKHSKLIHLGKGGKETVWLISGRTF